MKAILKFWCKPLLAAAVLALVLCLSAPAMASSHPHPQPMGFPIALRDEDGKPLTDGEVEVFMDFPTGYSSDWNEYWLYDGVEYRWFSAEAERDTALQNLKDSIVAAGTENSNGIRVLKDMPDDTKMPLINIGTQRINSKGEIYVFPEGTCYLFGMPMRGYQALEGVVVTIDEGDPFGNVPVVTVNKNPSEMGRLQKVDENKSPLGNVTFELWAYPVISDKEEQAVWIDKRLHASLTYTDNQGVPATADVTDFLMANLDAVAGGGFTASNEWYGNMETYSYAELFSGQVAIPQSLFWEFGVDGIYTVKIDEHTFFNFTKEAVPDWKEQEPFKSNQPLREYVEMRFAIGGVFAGEAVISGRYIDILTDPANGTRTVRLYPYNDEEPTAPVVDGRDPTLIIENNVIISIM